MKNMKVISLTLNLVIILLIGFLAGIIYTNEFSPKIFSSQEKTITLGIPAIGQDGKGVIGILKTTVKPGSGLILVNVNDILAQYDTQLSGRTAAIAAGKYANYNMKSIDVIYNIEVNASIIEGPSAGSSMAVSIVLALQNKTINNIMFTGTIDENGNIGSVGGIMQKAETAKNAGALLLVVPLGQGTEKKLTKSTSCKSENYCSITYKEENVNISSLGIEVKEAKNIDGVMKYVVIQHT